MVLQAHPDSVSLFARGGPAGLAEDGLPGAGRQADPGLRAADHSRGGGPALEGARREARQGLQAADGCLRGPAPGQDRGGGQ